MIATSIASIVTHQYQGQSFFTWQLDRRGLALKGGQDVGLVGSITARDVMSLTYETIAPETPIAAVRLRLQNAPWGELFVTDPDGILCGVIAFSDMQEAAFDTRHDAEWTASTVARSRPTVLAAGDDLDSALRAHGASGEVNLPVVDNRENRRLIGIAREPEVALAYQRALNQARAEEHGEV
jgi:CIC family chloride channel protein